MNPVMVVGASGSVGSYLMREFGSDRTVVGTYLNTPVSGAVPLDAADPDAASTLIREVKPRVVIICAALTNSDTCEMDPGLSERANARVPEVLAEICADMGIRLILLSTDYVFDGASGPYAEDAATGPINVYGRDKLRGESAVLASSRNAVVVRTSVVYGANRLGAVDQVLHFLSAGQSLPLSDHHQNTPTDVADLALLLRRLSDTDHGGIYHGAGPETMTRFAFGVTIARTFDLPTELILKLAPAPADGKAIRPQRCGLLIDRAANDFGYRPRSLEDGLAKHYVDR